jgi:hypothetical protein
MRWRVGVARCPGLLVQPEVSHELYGSEGATERCFLQIARLFCSAYAVAFNRISVCLPRLFSSSSLSLVSITSDCSDKSTALVITPYTFSLTIIVLQLVSSLC